MRVVWFAGVAVCGALLGTFTGAPARAEILDCTMTSLPTTGAVTKRYFIGDFPDTGKFMVFDSLIQQMVKAPVAPEVTERSDAKIRFKWVVRDVPMVDSRTNQVHDSQNMYFNAVYTVKTRQLMVRSKSGGYAHPAGVGKCHPVKKK